MTAGVRPIDFIFRSEKPKKWSSWDYALVEAFQTMEDEKCGQCGNPVWLCRSHDNTFIFRVKSEVCYASKAIEEYRDSAAPKGSKASKEDRKNWGKYLYTEAELLPFEKDNGKELPKRSDYLREKAGLVE